MRLKRSYAIIAGLVLAASGATATAAVGDDPSPQSRQGARSAAAAVPATCTTLSQQPAGGQQRVLLNNAPTTYTTAGWFNLKCGATTFTVPRGQQALVNLDATAELDCNGAADGWCQGRFLVNGAPVLPNNTDRADTYAWDSTNAEANHWSAHELAQALRVSCPSSSTTTTPCTYRVQLQAALSNGATSLWADDSTVKVDVRYGTVTSSVVPVS